MGSSKLVKVKLVRRPKRDTLMAFAIEDPNKEGDKLIWLPRS